MQAIKLNSPKRFKEATKKPIETKVVISETTELKEGVSLPNLEEVTTLPNLEEPTQTKEKVSFKEKTKNFFEQKVAGAISEIFRRKKLDESVEKSLSEGLEKNEEFAKADQKINKKRNWFAEKISALIKKRQEGVRDNGYEFNELEEAAMSKLEQELEDDFTKKIYEGLGKINKNVLLDHLVDNPAKLTEVKIIDLPTVSDAYENVVAFSDNGYLMQMSNKEEARNENGIIIDGEVAKYSLINPDGSVLSQGLNYKEALESLKQEAAKYHEVLAAEFAQQENTKNSLLEKEESNKLNEGEMSQKEKEANEIMDRMLADQKEIELQKAEEKEFFDNFDKGKATAPDKIIDGGDNNVLDVEPSDKDYKVTPEDKSDADDLEKEKIFFNPFNNEVSAYAEKMGIKLEELASNKNFLSLNPAEQQFVLETLRRSSISKVKVTANENFNKEKASKKWWQLGFAFNEKYHKERHQNEALQSIEKSGLEGYGGHQELEYLIDVVKNGPEVKMNEQGNLKIDFLRSDNFSPEDLEKVEEFNHLAEEYVKLSGDKKNEEEAKDLLRAINKVVEDLLGSVNNQDRYVELCTIFQKTKNSIDLVKFLSGDPETEKALDRMSKASSGGKLGAAWGMIKGQKDKLGYAGLGFTLRTGAKFALANAATLSAAVSYSVAPLAAAAVGAFRGYNTGKKEITEKEDLAKLGVKDKSGLTKGLNIASGVKVGQNSEKEIVFGLAEKLQNLTNKVKSARESRDMDLFDKLRSDLLVRINYTEDKMARDSVSYGSPSERKAAYFNLINSLSEAKLMIGIFNFNSPDKMYYQNTTDLYSSENLEAIRKEDKQFNHKQQEGESKEDYEKRMAVYKEKIRSRLEKFDVGQRLSVFLNYQEKKQNKKELIFLAKKAGKGALMGASFAAAGAFLADKLGLDSLFSKSDGGVGGTGTATPETMVGSSAESSIVVPPVIAGDSVAENIVNPNEAIIPEVESASIAGTDTSKYSDVISNKELNGKSDSIWRSVREIFKKNAADLGYKGDLDDVQAINKWAETQTAVAVNNSEGMDQVVFEGNKVELVRDGDSFKINLEKGDGIEPKEVGVVSTNRAEDLKDLEIERPGLKQEVPQEEISAKTIREQVSANSASAEQITSTAPNESVEEAATNETEVEQPVSKVDTPREDVNDLAAKKMARLVKGGNIAHNVSGEVYSGRFKGAEEFLSRLDSFNKELGVELSDAQKTEASGIWDSFKSHNDYNILRRNLDAFESRVISSANIPTETPIENSVDVVAQSAAPETKISNLEGISKELNLKSESLSKLGDGLVYEKSGLGKIFLEADGKSISKVIAPDNQEIPQDFVKEALGRRDLSKFAKQGGLDKILNNWNKLDSNDQLTLRTIDWINKSPEKWPPAEIFTQLKAIFKINTDNLIYDSAGKQILVKGDTRAFSMTLKGLKEMAKYLNK